MTYKHLSFYLIAMEKMGIDYKRSNTFDLCMKYIVLSEVLQTWRYCENMGLVPRYLSGKFNVHRICT